MTSGGELENDETTAQRVLQFLKSASLVHQDWNPNEPLRRITVGDSFNKLTEMAESSGKENEETGEDVNDDPELEDLLASTLSDFDKKKLEEFEKKGKEKEEKVGTEWTEDFIRLATQQFEASMRSALSAQGNAEGCSEASRTEPPDEAEFQRIMAEVLGKMNDSRAPNLNAEEPGDFQGIMPMMQGVMKQLLSKDMLYPALKDLGERYPAYLNEHKELPQEDRHRYEEQLVIIQELCRDFERGEESDAQFERAFAAMQRMQDLGHPPKELVGDVDLFPALPDVPSPSSSMGFSLFPEYDFTPSEGSSNKE
ncbi:unnamed protein product [Darwinula stevensoni]|uniref:Peroxin-19 n=1 Tax=Darwinula stevensoni TaxID=69355 RepID=A0A7R8X0L3_9CRUS|nr:unnamed protein product [Darwinula stevensoni]CAG0881804.1 unnamed protein product [Darwinula stevensoni]